MADGASVTCGVREMACRLNNDAASFEKAADNLRRAAQVPMSIEQLRQLVEAEGCRVLQAQRIGAIPPAFEADDCAVPDHPGQTRMSVGVDGVMVPLITDAEKRGRREKVVQQRRARASSGRKPAPLPPRRTGSDLPYKEFKTITFYDQAHDHRHIVLSRTQRTGAGTVLKREAARLSSLRPTNGSASSTARVGFRRSSPTPSCGWMGWAWTSTTSVRTCIAAAGRRSAGMARTEPRGPTRCCTPSSTLATKRRANNS